MITKQELDIGIDVSNVLNIYTYGSVVYKNINDNSDEDYIVVVKNNSIDFPKTEFNITPQIDITVYTEAEFQRLIDEHEISVLECLWLSDHLKYEEVTFGFKLNKAKLRESISAKCSNSWVKAKKKLTVEKDYDPYIAKKSLWHSIRIANFGWQIAAYGKIRWYNVMSPLYNEIMQFGNNWNDLNTKFKPIYNSALSNFRKFTPKEINV